MNGISVILCCHNSSGRLTETLKYLAEQILPEGVAAEVILVNNASTDDTVELSVRVWSQHQTTLELKIVEEDRPGQVYARMKGVEVASYELVIFCDDDNWLSPDYLRNAWIRMSVDTRIGALGGCGEAASTISFPDWFESNKSGYACGEQWSETGFCTKRMYLWGAGLVSRRSLLQKVFHPDFPMISTGRQEGLLFSGDDMEICKRIILMGYELFYDSALVYTHFLPAGRLTLDYLDHLNRGASLAVPVQRLYSYLILRRSVPGYLVPFMLVLHGFRYLMFRAGFRVNPGKPVINFVKVYLQGIRKSGNLHHEYLLIKAISSTP